MSKRQLPKNTTVAQLIAQQQSVLHLTDDHVATALGYENGAVIRMIKKGAIRLPLNRVYELAKVLKLEAGALMRTSLRETDPALLQAIERCLGPLDLTQGEVSLIEQLRELAPGHDTVPIEFPPGTVLTVLVSKASREAE